jgi:hypothetical protein
MNFPNRERRVTVRRPFIPLVTATAHEARHDQSQCEENEE